MKNIGYPGFMDAYEWGICDALTGLSIGQNPYFHIEATSDEKANEKVYRSAVAWRRGFIFSMKGHKYV